MTHISFVFIVLNHQLRTVKAIEKDVNALTFKWYNDVTPEKVNITAQDRNSHPDYHLVEYSRLYKAIGGRMILDATNFSTEFPDSISWTKSASFVDTVFYGYQKHHNVILRPDDMWTAIAVQFSLYVNANEKELRHLFVSFNGKKELQVKFSVPVSQVPITEFITKILSLTRENIEPSIYDWILPNFSTTTKNDEVTAGVALMSTVKHYFTYDLISVLCGIPQATILGTVDDWKEIRKRVDKLKAFELNGKDVMAKWSSMLGRILDQFISVKEGNPPNSVFWKQALRIDYKLVDMICDQVEEKYLNGWITAFSAFDISGNWQGDYENISETDNSTQWLSIHTANITPGVVHVPIQIYDEFNELHYRNYSGAIITGHMGYAVKKDEETIQPLSGWAMVTKNYYLPR